MDRKHRRVSGFTLVELLVVIAIVGILVSIMLPAVNRVREAGRRADCLNKVKEISQALLQYHNTHKSLPPGVVNCSASNRHDVSGTADCVGPNWLAAILPAFDEQKMYEDMVTCTSSAANIVKDCPSASGNTGTLAPASFICPSSTPVSEAGNLTGMGVGPGGLAKANYVGNFGNNVFINTDSQNNGAFEVVQTGKTASGSSARGKWKMASNQGVAIRDFRDGQSKTILVAEILPVENPADCRGAWFLGAMGASAFTGKFEPNPVHVANNEDRIPACGSAADAYPCVSDNSANAYASARSAHPGGVNIAAADGSSHFVNDQIDLIIWQSLTTRNGPDAEPNSSIPQD